MKYTLPQSRNSNYETLLSFKQALVRFTASRARTYRLGHRTLNAGNGNLRREIVLYQMTPAPISSTGTFDVVRSALTQLRGNVQQNHCRDVHKACQ